MQTDKEHRAIVLAIIDEEGSSYAWGVKRIIERQFGKCIGGSIYPLIHRIEAEGFLVSEEPPTPKSRRYYRLTETGRTEVRRLQDYYSKVYALLNPNLVVVPKARLSLSA